SSHASPCSKLSPQQPRLTARLLILDLGELGVDHVLVLLAGLRLARLGLALAGLGLGLLLLGVHLLAQRLRGLRQRLALGVDLGLVLGLEHALGVLDRRLDLLLLA